MGAQKKTAQQKKKKNVFNTGSPNESYWVALFYSLWVGRMKLHKHWQRELFMNFNEDQNVWLSQSELWQQPTAHTQWITYFRHWSLTHMSRAFLADSLKRVWRGDVQPEGAGLAGTGQPDQESRLARESREEWHEL